MYHAIVFLPLIGFLLAGLFARSLGAKGCEYITTGLMLISAGLMLYAFGFGVFTMFPVGFTALGGLLAVAAGKPDEEKSHF